MKLKMIFVLIIGSAFIITSLSCSKSKTDTTQQDPDGNNGGGGSAGSSSPVTVNIYNMAFPASTTVKKGTTVKWYNQDGDAHTVTSNDGSTFNSGNLAGGATYSYIAKTAGTFNYHCNYHSGMKGALVVTE